MNYFCLAADTLVQIASAFLKILFDPNQPFFHYFFSLDLGSLTVIYCFV